MAASLLLINEGVIGAFEFFADTVDGLVEAKARIRELIELYGDRWKSDLDSLYVKRVRAGSNVETGEHVETVWESDDEQKVIANEEEEEETEAANAAIAKVRADRAKKRKTARCVRACRGRVSSCCLDSFTTTSAYNA